MSKTQPGWVYFLENLTVPRIKIGWTSRRPVRRLLEIEHASGCEFKLLGYIWSTPADGNTEWALHKRFARWKIRRKHPKPNGDDYLGEYFSIEIKEEVIRIIHAARATGCKRS